MSRGIPIHPYQSESMRARLLSALPWAGALLLIQLMGGGVKRASAQQNQSIFVGGIIESNYATQPGFQVSYASDRIARGRPRFSFRYSTTRLSTALGSNALTEDRFQIGAAWYFRRTRTISPFIGLHVGYTRFDRENEEIFALLDNSAPILSLIAGTELKLLPSLRASASLGYSHLQSSTVYPLVRGIGLHYRFNAGRNR